MTVGEWHAFDGSSGVLMPSLDDQLRAYGRRIQQDVSPTPEQQERPGPGETYRGSTRWSRRTGWFLVAAATAAALVITASVLPVRSGSDIMNRKGSGLVVGICLVVGECDGGGGDEPPNTTPSSTVVITPLFSDDNSGAIEPGTYVVDRLGTPIQVTIPEGWSRYQDFAINGPNQSFLAFFDIVAVSADACQWWTNGTKTIGRSVDDLVTALRAQLNTVATTPELLEIDGYRGVKLTVEEPPNFDVRTCDEGSRMGWKDRSGNIIPIVNAGGLNAVMALDLDGERGVITYGSYEPPTAQTTSQLNAMVASLRIG